MLLNDGNMESLETILKRVFYADQKGLWIPDLDNYHWDYGEAGLYAYLFMQIVCI